LTATAAGRGAARRAADGPRTARRETRGARLTSVTIGVRAGVRTTAGVVLGGGGTLASAECSAISTVGAMTASAMAPAVSARRVDGRDSSASVFGPGHSRESH
jgi:hypothetical protein